MQTNIDDVSLAKLPLDSICFDDLRENDQIYVDKTKLIAEFAQLKATYFLARPRRFGKSLLIDILADLFSNGLKNFKGLAIENIWNDKTYNILRINFSSFSIYNAKKIKQLLVDELLEKTGFVGKIEKYDDNGEYVEPGVVLKKFAENIPNRSYVLLIDEYDAPFTHHLDNQNELQEITKIIDNFYYALKECSHKFRLIFITGITRVSHISLFSAFNNLVELTGKKNYADILGITQDELKKYFHRYIERAAKILAMTTDDVYTALKLRYDGFKFAINADQTLYNPWSIINFLLYPEDGFKNYWFDSGGTPSILVNYLKINKNFNIWEYKNRQFTITEDELSAKSEIINISPKLLLIQAGYFTINSSGQSYAKLYFPNTEVEESILRLYLSTNNIKVTDETLMSIDKICYYIDNHDINNIIKLFNLVLNDCVSPKSKFFNDECTLRDLIYAIIPNIQGLLKLKEREYTTGRSDLELITKNVHLVIEFKLTRSNRSAKSSLKEGISQIQSKRYGEIYFQDKKLFKIVLVASHREKRILPEFSSEVD